MRRLSLLALLALSSIAVAFATPGSVLSPNTPPDGTTSAEAYCLLDGLQFTGGLEIIGAFSPWTFHYQCGCTDWSKVSSVVAVPHLMDYGSSAEVTFNGVQVNFRTMGNAISNDGTVSD